MSPAAASALARMALSVGSTIREERQRRHWTLRDLAGRAGLALGAVHAIEAGGRASLESYARLATALGMRPSLQLERDLRRPAVDPRRDAEDFVHAAMGECEARTLRAHHPQLSIDEPYQHYQFAGRADVLAWRDRDLLHIENRTRFPNVQEAAGSYNAKRRFLAAAIADRAGIGPDGWGSVTHVLACLWSSEVLHVLRLRPATFEALCPDPAAAFEAWLRGEAPAAGVTSALVILDPLVVFGSRRRMIAGLDAVPRAERRYRDYADAADALRRDARARAR
jgi:transcriptional regulator with XRE-family HTH domain